MRHAKNENRHPLAGIGVVLALLSWGLLLLATPLYLEIGGWGRVPFLFFGILALLFSLVGALIELEKLLGKPPFGTMAPVIMLILLALGAHFSATCIVLPRAVAVFFKVIALVLGALGLGVGGYALPQFFSPWKHPQTAGEAQPSSLQWSKFLRIAVSTLIAGISLVVAIVQLLVVFSPD